MCRSKVQSVGNPTASLPPSFLLVAIMLIFAFDRGLGRKKKASATRERAREREKRNRKMGKVEMKCFSHMNASECICPQSSGRGVAWRQGGKRTKLGGHWKFFLRLMETGLLLLCCSVAGVAENVGNSWKQFFVVKGFKSRSRRVAQSKQALRRSAPKFFLFFSLFSLLFFLLLSHNEKQRAIYRVQTERQAAGGKV